jgi:serine-type D-Ala-D-Ala carboxypeptidase/endopeptidase (penicillin-binding protein 4)
MRALLVALAAATVLLAAPSAGAAPTPLGKLQASLRAGMHRAGRASGAYVLDLNTGRSLFASAATTPRLPASVEKLYPTATALLRFGPGATLTTSVYGVGQMTPDGTWHGTLYIRGGGDPTFGSVSYDTYAYGTGATMQRLVATLIRTTGIHAVDGALVGDESYLDSLRGTPATGYHVSDYVEGQLSGLIYDRGFADQAGTAFQNRPALFTTAAFAAALRAGHVKVPSSTPIYTGGTPLGAARLASVNSPTMATLIKLTNTPSDNFFAEMLIKDIGARFARAGTTAAGAAVVSAELASQFGIHPTLLDGSGLSHDDHTSPLDVVTLLRKMSGNTPFVNSLAVAGRTGTLMDEMRGTVAQGVCRGKTGTLQAVSNLVGYCTARDSHTLAFAFLMGKINPYSAHPIQNKMAEALAAYNG